VTRPGPVRNYPEVEFTGYLWATAIPDVNVRRGGEWWAAGVSWFALTVTNPNPVTVRFSAVVYPWERTRPWSLCARRIAPYRAEVCGFPVEPGSPAQAVVVTADRPLALVANATLQSQREDEEHPGDARYFDEDESLLPLQVHLIRSPSEAGAPEETDEQPELEHEPEAETPDDAETPPA
jgi:hypothetical protein